MCQGPHEVMDLKARKWDLQVMRRKKVGKVKSWESSGLCAKVLVLFVCLFFKVCVCVCVFGCAARLVGC